MDIPGLAMSRSVGDTVAHTAGVISDPEMHVVELTPEDKVIVWASDGLWEFMSNQEVSAPQVLLRQFPLTLVLYLAAVALGLHLASSSHSIFRFLRLSLSVALSRTLARLAGH